MDKKCMLQLVIYLTVHLFLTSHIESYSNHLDTSKAIAQFSAFISVLDSDNNRYTADELVPLIAKVATRFKRIYIELDLTEILKSRNLNLSDQRPSNLWSAVAAAKYNCLPSTKEKIEVVLLLKKYTYSACDCFTVLKKPFEKFSDEANKICNGTVSTILVSVHQFCYAPPIMLCTESELNSIDENKLQLDKYKWGISTSFERYCKQTTRSRNLYFDPAVVLLEYENDEEMMLTDVTQCKSYNDSTTKPVEFIKKMRWTDRQVDHVTNMSNLILNWKKQISELPENGYILLQAFDYTGGWWFLSYDPANTNTSAFVFKEKILVASEVDREEDPKNFGWLKEEIVFNADSIGILSKRDTFLKYIAHSGFCHVVRFELGYRTEDLYRNLLEVNNETCGENSRVIYSSNFKPVGNIERNFKTYNVTLLLDFTKGFVLLDFNLNEKKKYYIKTMEYTQVLQGLKQSGKEYGYSFYINICQDFSSMDGKSQKFLLELLRDPNSTMNVFAYEENEFDVVNGARQMLIKRITLFEDCRKLVLKSGNNKTKIGFAMQGYYRVDDFYRSPWALQNYVKYMKMMNDWVGKQMNTIVYLGTLRDGEHNGGPVVGWLTLDNSQAGFTTKQQDALKLSRFYYPEPIISQRNVTKVEVETRGVASNSNEIMMVTCVAVGVCLVVVFCSAFFIRAYYKKDELSDEEIEMFFSGNDVSDLETEKFPYDNNKYEISEDAFSFEKDKPLGSGEFGMVFRGTVTTADGKFIVAVKTTNLNTRHKTTLKGLLSEIKVLAHVGKHENIIELLGANTSSLKDGNVYIFLELCELGSLEKYLRVKRSGENFSVEDNNFDSPSVRKDYIAISELTRYSLNKSLSDDLYRWSTEICNGMLYLAQKNVIHADLATRNVLLNLNREAKICDFGLSRRMYNYTNYVKTGQEPLPWKWMAPEALRYMKFDEKTDVWSFGVTLWEIYSLGSTPFPGLSWDLNFPQMLERGFRLGEPEFVERDMYQVMQNCWKTDPGQRPTFYNILSKMTVTDL